MIKANELRIGNLVTWNPKLMSPNNTLPPMWIEVFGILQDRISYGFPNIENRVEPFEDDVAQAGINFKRLEELEPIKLTAEMLENAGFKVKSPLMSQDYFEKCDLQLKHNGEYFQRVSVNKLHAEIYGLPIRYFHQLQNLFFAITSDELEIKLHGQQT